jgi:hypothetical protein
MILGNIMRGISFINFVRQGVSNNFKRKKIHNLNIDVFPLFVIKYNIVYIVGYSFVTNLWMVENNTAIAYAQQNPITTTINKKEE